MTPRINNPASDQDLANIFSQTLLQEVRERKLAHNLKLRAPIFDLLHPRLIETKLKYLNNPEQDPPVVTLQGWHFYPLVNLEEAPEGIQKIYGQPFEIGKILKDDIKEVVIDFSPLGAVLLSRSPKDVVGSKGIHQHLIPVWMNYVFSAELWGEQGKWTRFHERLHLLFDKHGLLKGKDYPGYYPLDLKASRLEEFGYQGTVQDETYILTMSWTFPLTALQYLEKVILEEF